MSGAAQPSPGHFLAKAFPTFFGPKGVLLTKTAAARKGKTGKVSRTREPAVNLMPPEFVFKAARRETLIWLLVAGVGIVLVAGGGVAVGLVIQSFQLGASSTATQALTARQGELARQQPLIAYLDSLDSRKALVLSKTQQTIDYPAVQNSVFEALPLGATLSTVSISPIATPPVTKVGVAVVPCGIVTDPLGANHSTSVACLRFNGVATDQQQIVSMGLALQHSTSLNNVSIVVTSGTDRFGGIHFEGTATIVVPRTGTALKPHPAPSATEKTSK